MAIKCVLDSLDGVHEDLIPHYVKKADKFELQLEGARTQGDVDRLQASLVQEREFSKGLKAFKEACGEHKAEEVAALLQSIPELKVMAEAGGKKFDQTQFDAMITSRLTPVQAELAKAKQTIAERDAAIVQRDNADRRRAVHDAVRLAAVGAEVIPQAYANEHGSLMLLADKLFTVDATGAVVVGKDASNAFIEGTLLKDALPVLLDQHPYLRPPSQGGGAGGSKNESGNGANVFLQNNMQVRTAWINANQDKPGVVQNAMTQAGLSHAAQTYVAKK